MLKPFRQLASGLGIALLCATLAHAEPGVSDNRIVFGQSLGYDSVWGGLFKNYSDGMLAYFAYINKKEGGVYGRLIEVKRMEDNYSVDKVLKNVKEFGEKNEVFGLVCMGGTGPTLAFMPLLEQYKLPTVGTLTGFEGVRKYNRYLFHTRTGYSNEVEKMVKHFTSVGISKIAVVYQDNAFGNGMLAAVKREAAGRNVKIVAEIAHAAKGDDIDKVLPKISEGVTSTGAQAMLLFTSPESVAQIVKGYLAKYENMPQPWVLSVTSPSLVYTTLKEQARGIAVTQVMPHPQSRATRLTREFNEIMPKYANNPNNLTYEAVEGFITGKIVVEALKRAGPKPTREAYVRALEGFGSVDFGDVFVKYSKTDHGGPTYTDVTIMARDGSIVR